ncbi:hypothetical protein GQ44DRAFT_824334 [Phaeosphaeriaceae sp. PMI808]|nr:hypothetical protein GQ44DRAFT_824334 [Phaeosphaeriaceae sp. PMI808]
MNIIIVGGSLGGLFMGVALKRLRKDLPIRIFERNATPLLHDQGAGVVASLEVQQFFKAFDRTQTPLTITSHQRLYLNNEGIAVYEHGCTVTEIKAPGSTERPSSNYSEPVKISIKHHSGDTSTTDAGLVIAADGPNSTIRAMYLPDVRRTYAGYVAWRGTVDEDRVSQAARDVFVEKFAFFHSKQIQILAHTIPGKHGTLEPSKRLLNWVWYVNYKEDSPEHVDLMADKEGKRHHTTLPTGGITFAKEILPPQFAELVAKTEVPFIQAITDVIAPSAALKGGRVLLIGDALSGFRPHTAMSTGQAAMNASKLAGVLGEIIEGQDTKLLQEWKDHVVNYAKTLQKHGVQIGNRSQFQEHPLSS